MKKTLLVAGTLIALGTFNVASAWPPPSACGGAYSGPSSCTLPPHGFNPLNGSMEFVTVVGTGSGPISVTLTDSYNNVLVACGGIGSCANGAVVFTHDDPFTCTVTTTGSGWYQCIMT